MSAARIYGRRRVFCLLYVLSNWNGRVKTVPAFCPAVWVSGTAQMRSVLSTFGRGVNRLCGDGSLNPQQSSDVATVFGGANNPTSLDCEPTIIMSINARAHRTQWIRCDHRFEHAKKPNTHAMFSTNNHSLTSLPIYVATRTPRRTARARTYARTPLSKCVYFEMCVTYQTELLKLNRHSGHTTHMAHMACVYTQMLYVSHKSFNTLPNLAGHTLGAALPPICNVLHVEDRCVGFFGVSFVVFSCDLMQRCSTRYDSAQIIQSSKNINVMANNLLIYCFQ